MTDDLELQQEIAAHNRVIGELFAAFDDLKRKLRALHTEFRVYDECDHEHELNEDGSVPDGVIEIDDIGLTCELMYSICVHCCCSPLPFRAQTEDCATDHTHGHDVPICPTRALVDGVSPEQATAIRRANEKLTG